ncbi:membrane protein insertase YidC [uncultured Corynebacterium sp.]|uniref:membrane protein insertase YidC n=1 Tax=uncultured Corynebacterium sp. TaxID=159447 RepID=UPI0025EFD7FB|nr:membrane protein insertase YidC [uncultured Corynebacterium sp.]
MIDIFVYPVSAIMKLWHLLAATFMDNSTAWIASIVLLVLTVRGFIAPLNWLSVKAARLGALMRPENEALTARLNDASTPEEAEGIIREQNALRERFGYNPAAGCLPVFIMIPFFIGLYQVVLRMSRRTDLHRVGLLNEHDIDSFRAATINDVSIVALARDHVELVTPILAAAIVFTILNSILSMYRTFQTTRFEQTFARRMFWFTCLMVILAPWILWNAAVNTIVPVAVILYWGCTYLFTLIQTLVYNYILHKRYPLTEEVHQMRHDAIRSWRRPRKERKAEKAARKAERLAIPREERQAHRKMIAEAHSAIRAERKAAKQQSAAPAPQDADSEAS